MKQLQKTARDYYHIQKGHAKEREIEFPISLEDWLELWLDSGKWKQRGKGAKKYQMCRYGDVGPYSRTNCYIATGEQNQWDAHQIPIGEHRAIYIDWCTGLFTQQQIAEKYGRSQSHVSNVIRESRESWSV